MNAELMQSVVVPTRDRKEVTPADLLSVFDLVATAPEGLNRLRELIVDFAVRGRLVEQNPRDEHASKLLDQVRRERERMVASGEIKRAEEPQVGEGIPSDLPHGWVQVRLGTVICLISGQHLKPAEYQHTPETAIPYLTGPAEFGTKYPQPKRWTRLRKAVARAGDILVTVKGAGVGKLNIVQSAELAISRQLMAVRVIGVNQDFIEIALRALAESLRSKSIGIAIPGISREDIQDAVIRLPPLAEQRRIAVRFAELMNLCELLEVNGWREDEQHARLTSVIFDSLVASESPKAFAQNWRQVAEHFDLLLDRPEAVDVIEQTILELAFRGLLGPEHRNDEPAEKLLKRLALCNEIKDSAAYVRKLIEDRERPFKLPPSWDWVRLGDIVSIRHGFAFSSESFTSEPTPFVLTTPGHFHEKGGFRDRGPRTKYYDGSVDPSFILKPGDLIIPMTEQAPGLLGSPAFVPDDGKTYLHNQRLGKLVFSSDLIAPEFIFWFFNCAFFRSELAGTCTGMKVRHTSPKKILNVPVPVCSLAEQHRIVDRIKQLRELCAKLRECLSSKVAVQERLADAALATAVE